MEAHTHTYVDGKCTICSESSTSPAAAYQKAVHSKYTFPPLGGAAVYTREEFLALKRQREKEDEE